ncbi:MAG TPA: alcohol dehydrogenase catalytic domain-containing protein [Acidimicrobiia bacterium]|jgi:propanol-preferring alcohol dehydrogenase
MRAWVVARPGPIDSKPLALVDRDSPAPDHDELLVRVRVCGVCRTDLHLAEGDLAPRDASVHRTPGHEIVGTVAAIGRDVAGFDIGQRVGALGIYGFGASAHLTAQIALAQGMRVHVLTRSVAAQQLALELGCHSAAGADDSPPELLDGAVLFAPVGTLVPPALAALDRGGTLSIAGIHLSDIPALEYEHHVFQERTLTSTTANTRADGRALFELAAASHLRVRVTEYGFDALPDALADVAHDRLTGAAVVHVA